MVTHLYLDHTERGGWTTDRILRWAKTFGPRSVECIDAFIQKLHFPVQEFGTLRGALSRGKLYGASRMEGASELALKLRLFGAQDVESILKHGREAASSNMHSRKTTSTPGV